MHNVMGDLLGVPVFALDQDVLLVPAQLQVDAAIETGTAATGADMVDAPALRPIVIGQHRLQPIPPNLRQSVIAAVAYALQSVHSAPREVMDTVSLNSSYDIHVAISYIPRVRLIASLTVSKGSLCNQELLSLIAVRARSEFAVTYSSKEPESKQPRAAKKRVDSYVFGTA